jgi:hypothetical protein
MPKKNCTFDVTDKIKLFLTRGWESTTNSYGKTAKDRTVSPDANDTDLALMKLLGATREYIVQKSFACNKTSPDQQMVVSGSTNPTSDYDATLIGSGACDTMWAIFDDFAKTYGTSLPQSLDVNLYVTGMYLAERDTRSSRELGAKKLDFTNDGAAAWTLTPCKESQRKSMEVWASIKLAEINYSPRPNVVMIAAVSVQKRMQRILDVAMNVTKAYGYDAIISKAPMPKPSQTAVGAESKMRRVTDWTLKNNELVKLVAKYALQHYFGSMFNERTNKEYVPERNDFQAALHSSLDKLVAKDMDIMDLLCHVRYFSIEGAYTQGTVNAVVIAGQLGVADLQLDPCDHWCSMIENYADFVKHSLTIGGMSAVQFALKFSKYVVRMLDAAIALGNDDFVPVRARFVDRVYRFRSAGTATDDVLSKELYTIAGTRGKFATISDLVAGVSVLFEQLKRPRLNSADREKLFEQGRDDPETYEAFYGGSSKKKVASKKVSKKKTTKSKSSK